MDNLGTLPWSVAVRVFTTPPGREYLFSHEALDLGRKDRFC